MLRLGTSRLLSLACILQVLRGVALSDAAALAVVELTTAPHCWKHSERYSRSVLTFKYLVAAVKAYNCQLQDVSLLPKTS